MILLSGDFHANERHELSIVTKRALIKKYGQNIYDNIKYHIILGDGGFMWPNNERTDRFNYKTLALRSFPILCVIGNHEPILGMKNLTETDIGIGETVYQINADPFVAYLKRGKVYFIDGIKFLVLGGALSIDKNYRTPNKTWWENEYWDEQEKVDVFKLLETEKTFDCVISHTGPQFINNNLFKNSPSCYEKSFDEVAILNNKIYGKVQFKEWLCGHWHKDNYYFDKKANQGYQYLYKTTKILEKKDNRIIPHNEYGKSYPSN